MTVEEFSNQFDILVNSYRRLKDFDNKEELDSIEFDEYEKSLFLTKAQEELVISLYSGRNAVGSSFEETEELRRYLSDLVVEENLEPITGCSGSPIGIDSKSQFFTLPEDLWFITYEAVTTDSGKCGTAASIDVFPVKQDEYLRIKRNPFRGANDRRALRLDLADGVIEVVCKYTVSKYYIRYIRKIDPIVLVDLPNNLTINGVDDVTESELHPILHQKILEIAVGTALQSKGLSLKSQSKNNN